MYRDGYRCYTAELVPNDVLHDLRALLHEPDAIWRSDLQRTLFIELMELKRDVVAAMQTNTGKSLPVILAARLT